MRFVIDSLDWCFDGWTASRIEAALDLLLDRIEVARSRDEVVGYSSELFSRSVADGRTMWELFGQGHALRLSRDLQERLSAAFSSAPKWDDGEDWPATFGLEIDGTSEDNPDVAWVHQKVLGGEATAVLGLARRGKRAVVCDSATCEIHWVTDDAEHVGFFRDAIDVERDTEETLESLAAHAFPNLVFLPGVWRGLRDFVGGYTAVRGEVRRYLAVFDDHGRWVFTAPPPALSRGDTSVGATSGSPSKQLIADRFNALGVTVAPENPNVGQDSKCRAARERTIEGKVLYCEWHGKLQPHQNRVHIHAPVPASGGRVVIAIFHAHLVLP